MDPAHGELSRALRNRGVEVFIHPNVSWLLVWLEYVPVTCYYVTLGECAQRRKVC